jgi:N-formylglutamate deformylase
MGLIRRNALPGVPMYDRKLEPAEVERRINAYYRPYRERLRERLDALHARFGTVWHINCHSMKSRGNAMNLDDGAARPDFVVSDRRGTTAGAAHTAWVAEWFRGRGHAVGVNEPYEGGDLVRSFGAPARGRHSIQIEINRGLYMDEAAFAHGARFGDMRALCGELARALAAYVGEHRSARSAR